MFTAAFLIPLTIECALAAAQQATSLGATQAEVDSWKALLQPEPLSDEAAWLRAQVAEALAQWSPGPAPASPRFGDLYPMRIYGCDASGPRQEWIASPALVVVPVSPGDR
jgi:hypothetical protein